MAAGLYGEDEAVENPALDILEQLGWETVSAFNEKLGPAGTLGRESHVEMVLTHRLRPALERLNPGVPSGGIDKAFEALLQNRSAKEATRANREVYELIRGGIPVETEMPDGTHETVRVRFVDWNDSTNNDWLAVSQFWITGEMYKRSEPTSFCSSTGSRSSSLS